MKINSLVLSVFLVCFLFLLVSCGKSVPPPPRLKTELVLDIFDALRRQDHKDALAKIERLRELDKTNVFVSEFENVERANLKLKEAEVALTKNQKKEAERCIQDAIRIIGPMPSLVVAMQEIVDLSRLDTLSEQIANPSSSEMLTAHLLEFRKTAQKFKKNQKLLAFAEKRDKMVEILKRREDRLTFFSLDAEGICAKKNAKSVAETIDSQKRIEQNLLH